MTRSIHGRGMLALLSTAILLMGCADPKDKKIAELNGELDRLRTDLANRDRQVNDLTTSDEDAQKSIRDLNTRIAEMRDQMAKAQAAGAESGEGKWIGMPGFDMLSIPGEVLFDSGKSVLKPGGRTTMDRIASDIRARYSDRDVYVFGHTDNEPIRKSGWKDNWQLGSERALSAVRYLVAAGIPASRLIQANCGEYRPRVPNSSLASKRQNRRVEFYAVKHSGGVSTETGNIEESSGATPAGRAIPAKRMR